MEQPLVSFLVLTYNQESFVEDAIKGALSQDYPNIEIIISDDCSLDRTPDVIEKSIGNKTGECTIIYNHNEKNLGLVGNLNKALSLSHGEYIIFAAGDDISLPNRTSISVQKIIEYKVDSLALNFQYIDSKGNKINRKGYDGNEEQLSYNLDDYIMGRDMFLTGPSRIVTRRLFDVFGMLHDDCQTEDTTCTLRALFISKIVLINQVGVMYRWHNNNISSYDSIMTRINPMKIYNQYKFDLETAYYKSLISKRQYDQVKQVLLDYKCVQVFLHQLYHSKSRIKKHILGLLFWLNPYVLKRHKTNSWLKKACPELFIVKNIIKKLYK